MRRLKEANKGDSNLGRDKHCCMKILEFMFGFCSKEQQEGQVRQAENQEGIQLQLETVA